MKRIDWHIASPDLHVTPDSPYSARDGGKDEEGGSDEVYKWDEYEWNRYEWEYEWEDSEDPADLKRMQYILENYTDENTYNQRSCFSHSRLVLFDYVLNYPGKPICCHIFGGDCYGYTFFRKQDLLVPFRCEDCGHLNCSVCNMDGCCMYCGICLLVAMDMPNFIYSGSRFAFCQMMLLCGPK